jgi:hypothetical protein
LTERPHPPASSSRRGALCALARSLTDVRAREVWRTAPPLPSPRHLEASPGYLPRRRSPDSPAPRSSRAASRSRAKAALGMSMTKRKKGRGEWKTRDGRWGKTKGEW